MQHPLIVLMLFPSCDLVTNVILCDYVTVM